MAVNKVILIGNVGSDPEIKYLQEDVPVARFSLATNETYKNKSGEKVTNTEWHNIVIWRGLAKVVEKYVKKGSKLYIEGKITTRQYEKDGQTKYFTEIVAREMHMLDGKSDGNFDNNANSNENNRTAPIQTEPEMEQFDSTDDLPF